MDYAHCLYGLQMYNQSGTLKMSFDESKHVAFEGQRFRIEWYVDSSGESEALQYSEEMPKSHKAKLAQLFKVMGDLDRLGTRQNFVMKAIRFMLLSRSHTDFYASSLLGKKSSSRTASIKMRINCLNRRKNWL